VNTQKSIAVLPFCDLSVDGNNDFLCDGITEEVINGLSKIEGMKVISRASSFFLKTTRDLLKKLRRS
jgi:adenylate cyclase